MYASTTSNSLEVSSQFHTIYTLRFPYNMVSASIETSPSSMRATKIILHIGPDLILFIIQNIPSVGNVTCVQSTEISQWGILTKTSYRFCQWLLKSIQLGGTVYKTKFLVTDYLIMEALTATWFIYRHINSIYCIDRRKEFAKGKIMLHGSAPNKPTTKELESMEDDYSGSTTDRPSKKIDYYLDIMRNKVALRKRVRIPPYL